MEKMLDRASEAQQIEIQKVFDHFNQHGEKYLKVQNTTLRMQEMLDEGVQSLFLRRLLKMKAAGRGVTLKKMILKYGKEIGLQKWKNYCKIQGEVNTFEYKSKKYGMTKKEFKLFNLSRACTLENFIMRHGKEEGKIKWDNYCKRQKYAGNEKEYFIEKLGYEKGIEKYIELNKRKALNLKNFQIKYGAVEGEIKWEKYRENCINLTLPKLVRQSKAQLELCKRLTDEFKNLDVNIHDGIDTPEFHRYDKISKQNYFYDFVISSPIKIVIEFNGDFWHANPKTHHKDDLVKIPKNHMTAETIWEKEKIKLNCIKRCGFDVLVIWESDYNENKEREFQKCVKFINTKLAKLNLLND